MLAGAVTAFAVTVTTGSATLGILTGAIAGALLALVFGVLTLSLTSNQVATGLALTIFGIGLSALIGSSFVGIPVERLPRLRIPGLSDLPVIGPLLFGHDVLVYLSVAAHRGGGLVPQAHARRHDPARGRRIRRLGALDRLRRDQGALPRGAVRRRHGRPRRRLPVALLHADVGRGDDRRARLDRARAGGVRLLAALARCCSAPICSAASPSSSSMPRARAASTSPPR